MVAWNKNRSTFGTVSTLLNDNRLSFKLSAEVSLRWKHIINNRFYERLKCTSSTHELLYPRDAAKRSSYSCELTETSPTTSEMISTKAMFLLSCLVLAVIADDSKSIDGGFNYDYGRHRLSSENETVKKYPPT
ncbi:hypothetical protein CEXT_460261 [Caerostris extrusa]|uniref:Uncharacterized protein n=1 Tax=Caerostris extrusa TaxID=172846 RepID=A0AAV4WEH3_CAEEX|nr:hypothetical protein CEXT_460261 [Caerostris extrusa]